MSARTIIVGTAGHIDHGKTALVRALTGIDCDRLPEEKTRGITIDLGFANLRLGDLEIGIVDVPGHERFVRNMLAGASGIDLALLVIAADDSVMPQTREHLAILELLRIERGVIALTKCDLPDSGWIDLVEQEVRELVAGTFLADAPIVRTSAQTGEGIETLRSQISLTANTIGPAPRDQGFFRLPIDRAFVGQGVGTIVTGTVWSGEMQAGRTVVLLPSGREVRVRALQSHGREADRLQRGQRGALNLMGVHHTDIERGNEVVDGDSLIAARVMTVALRATPDAPWPIRHRARVRLHLGTQEILASVRLLEPDRTEIAPGARGFAQLILASPGVAAPRQPFVVRAESPLITIGGGVVLDPNAAPIRRSDRAAVPILADLVSDDPSVRLAAALALQSARSCPIDRLAAIADIANGALDSLLEDVRASGEIVHLGGRGRGTEIDLHRDVVEGLRQRMIAQMERLHDRSPLDTAIPRNRLTAALQWRADESVLESVIDLLIERGDLKGDELRVTLASFRPKLSEKQRQISAQIMSRFDQAGFMPPDLSELASSFAVKEAEVRSIAELCCNAGVLVHLGGGLYLHAEHETEMRRRVVAGLAAASGLAVSEIRDMLGTSRKYAVPFCEYLDRIGLTRRVGDVRVAGSPVRAAS